jgi:phosphopantothenoylcysteine decarboxylase/phosphopantothenate--cysteine ligase
LAKILLGVSAGIAAYKAVDLASTLTQRGDRVVSLFTPNASRFITPLTLRAVTRERVYTDTFEDAPDGNTEHISLADWGDLVIVAPATADLIGRLAAGLADDIVTTTLLAFQGPVVVAPAMNDKMWAHALVQRNIQTLRDIGYVFVNPEDGHLACGSVGPGRLATTESILEAVRKCGV